MKIEQATTLFQKAVSIRQRLSDIEALKKKHRESPWPELDIVLNGFRREAAAVEAQLLPYLSPDQRAILSSSLDEWIH